MIKREEMLSDLHKKLQEVHRENDIYIFKDMTDEEFQRSYNRVFKNGEDVAYVAKSEFENRLLMMGHLGNAFDES